MKKCSYASRFKKSNSRKRKFGGTKPTLTQKIKNACKRKRNLPKKDFGETKPNYDQLSLKIKSNEVKNKNIKFQKDNELDEYQKMRETERVAEIEKDRQKENQIVFSVVEPIRKDPNRGMRFVDCSKPINQGRLGHSKVFLNKTEKKYEYY